MYVVFEYSNRFYFEYSNSTCICDVTTLNDIKKVIYLQKIQYR